MITSDNPAFLKELLNEVGRVDLVEKVEEYVRRVVDGKNVGYPECLH